MMELYEDRIPVIDYHTHFLTKHGLEKVLKRFGEKLEDIRHRNKRLGVPPFELFDAEALLDKWLTEMKRYKLSYVVFFVPQTEIHLVGPLISQHKDRFRMFYQVNEYTEDTPYDIEESIRKYGVAGIKLVPNIV
ncbi:MAG: hypothetical protein ACTSW4_02820, partial [Candidatus Ranarchaeia archaeon]